MVRHYDMVTGEVIGEKRQGTPLAQAAGFAETPELRLMTLQEAAALQCPPAYPPADIATQPVSQLLATWD